MDWFISLEKFEDLAVSRPDPPYILLLAGLLITLACALPLTIIIRQRIKYWSKNLSPDTLPSGGRLQVILPFSGTISGVCIFLTAALEALGSPVIPAIFFSLIFTLLIGYFAWLQLGKMLSRRAIRSYIEQSSDFPSAGSKPSNVNQSEFGLKPDLEPVERDD